MASVKTVTAVHHPGAMQSAHSFSCTSCCHPRAGRAPGTLQPQAQVQGSTLCSSFLAKDSSLQRVLSTAGKKWKNYHTPSPLQSQRPKQSGAELPDPLQSSALVTDDVCGTSSPAYQHFFLKQMKISLMLLSQLSVTDYCCSFLIKISSGSLQQFLAAEVPRGFQKHLQIGS